LRLRSVLMFCSGNETVTPERFGERDHSAVDMMVLLAVVLLALGTWSSLADASGVPLWKPYVSVVTTVLFALAALTRHPNWAASIRLLTGGWIVAAPYPLKLEDIAPALWAHLAIGSLVTMASLPGVVALRDQRARTAI